VILRLVPNELAGCLRRCLCREAVESVYLRILQSITLRAGAGVKILHVPSLEVPLRIRLATIRLVDIRVKAISGVCRTSLGLPWSAPLLGVSPRVRSRALLALRIPPSAV